VKQASDLLGKLVDEGVHTPLPLEIKKIKQQLDKKQITLGQLDNLIQMLANKYKQKEEEESNNENENHTSVDYNVQPDIVISETFIA
jgi:ABC-type Zn2+ transport system substrate-binding protein/surface adhesin